jgi:hypothetical protein
MALQDYDGTVLAAFGGGFYDEDVAGIICFALKGTVCSEFLQISTYMLFVTRLPGDACDLLEEG